MNLLLLGAAFLTLCSCSGQRSREHANMIGMNSSALAARYGTPASYRDLDEYLQLSYGSAAVGCQVMGWSTSSSA